MIRVHVWNFEGSKTAWGHASMHVGNVYISWWPDQVQFRQFKLPDPIRNWLPPIYSVRHIHGQSWDDDVSMEGREPSHKPIELTGLDEDRLLAWWHQYNTPGRLWTTLGENCSTTVARGLMIAGADDYALGASGWWRSWNVVWSPNDVLLYARAVRNGLLAKRGQHAAINLIRRFCNSPLGFTSLTVKLDIQGLAEAIYRELGGNSARILEVFRELDWHRNTFADDVAEVYVHLLQTRAGSPLVAVTQDQQLRALLIKVLREGWTTGGQKQCIEFLNSL